MKTLEEEMRCRIYVSLIALEVIVLTAMVGGGYFSAARMKPVLRDNRQLARAFELTDLALWTGARYTRHLSQADLFAAFQDSMGALEHFPEGALAPVPILIRPSETLTFEGAIPAAAEYGEIENEPAS